MRRFFLLLILALAALVSLSAVNEVKIVTVGSHLPTLAKLKMDISRYESAAPFDGATFYIGGSSDVFNPKEFTEAQKGGMREAAKLYGGIAFTKWKYNFLSVLVDQHRPEWFDDCYWENVKKNWVTAAKLAKQLKFVGICLDPEGYGVYPVDSHWKSAWWIKGGKGRDPDRSHTGSEYLEEARKRGRQIGDAIFKEYPEMVLWGYYLWSFNGADLMGAFCNGILEAMPPKARIVDGDEWVGYCAKGEAAYDRMKARNESGCGMLDKKLIVKHRKQGGFAPPFYLDAYAFPEKNDCLHPDIKSVKSRTKYFAENLKAAKRKATGGFIWIYGEKNTWWTPSEEELRGMEKAGKNPTPTWEQALPGIREVLFGGRIGKTAQKRMGGRNK